MINLTTIYKIVELLGNDLYMTIVYSLKDKMND
jgi:hypothetical protein